MKRQERTNKLKPIERISKDCDYLGYMSDTSNNFYPSKSQWRERLCYTMLEWAEKDHNALEDDCKRIHLAWLIK